MAATLVRLTHLAQASVVAVLLWRLHVPHLELVRHGAWPWATVVALLTVWPLVLVATWRSRPAWTTAVAVWACTVVALAARLQRWLEPTTVLVTLASLALAAAAAGVVWGDKAQDSAPSSP